MRPSIPWLPGRPRRRPSLPTRPREEPAGTEGDTKLATPENRQDGDCIIIAGRDSAQDSINQVGQEMTRRDTNTQPTLTSRPGLQVRIIVNKDLTLRSYQPSLFNRGTSR